MKTSLSCVRVLVAGCALAVAACSASAQREFSRPLTIEPLTLAAAPPSAMPRLTVTGDRAIVSWVDTLDTMATLKYAERTATGWSEPRAATSGRGWFLSSADLPSVLPLADGTLVAHWLVSTDQHREAYDLHLTFSKDKGQTWSAPTTPHHDGTKTQHGFASLLPMPGGGVRLVWLDGRQTDDPVNDNMSVRAAVFDSSGAQTSESIVDDRVCDCCPTALALTSEGPIAAFRDRSAKEVRDIAVSRLVNGAWTAARAVHDDGWEIEACPVNGPAIAAAGRTVVVAWFTAAHDQGRAFAAFSQDAGVTFGAPVRLDDVASLGRVDVALLDDGSAVASWIEFADGRATLRIRHVDGSGRRAPAQTVSSIGAASGRPSGYPRLVHRGQELLFAWTETQEGNSIVKTAAARLP